MAQSHAEPRFECAGHFLYRFGDFVLDETRTALFRGDEEITLRRQAFDMLLLLIRHQGELVSKDLLMEEIWGDSIVTENSITQCLRDVRHAIGDDDFRLIKTVPRRGFIFEMPVTSIEVEVSAAPGNPVRERWLIFAAGLGLAVLAWLAFDHFVVRPAPEAESVHTIAAAGDTVAAGETPSLAVLPLLDLSPAGDFGYFADGLTEDLLNLLSGFDGLRVAARTSSFYYKDKLDEVPLSEIARQLNVTHVLEGSVRRDNDLVRVTVQLIKTEDGFHIWSNTWDRTLGGIFAIQDEIAAVVTDELKVSLLGEVPRAAVVDSESYELALQARYLMNRRTDRELEAALELFQRAVELDPDNAAAWVGLVPLYLWLFDPPRLDYAQVAAERAVELEPESPEAWSRLSQVLQATGDADGASRAWVRALELGADSPLIQSQQAGWLAEQGDLQGAIELQKIAVALDPLYLTNIGNLAAYLLLAGRLDEAAVYAGKLLTLAPENYQGLELMAEILLLQSRPLEALALIEKRLDNASLSVMSKSNDWFNAIIQHALGNSEESNTALDRYLAEWGDQAPAGVACLHAWRGEHDAAFEWLNRALEQDPELSIQISHEPMLDSLQTDPRWDALMKRWNGRNQAIPGS